jgi:hypothetical protein
LRSDRDSGLSMDVTIARDIDFSQLFAGPVGRSD